MSASPLALWSWHHLPKMGWEPAVRLRALALGQAMAQEQGFRTRFYGCDKAIAELKQFPWPWETRLLPAKYMIPDWFWSAGKLDALYDAAGEEPGGTMCLHVDTDSLITGKLRDVDGAALYGDHEERFNPKDTLFYNPEVLRHALGYEPSWFQQWKSQSKVVVCALVGGADTDSVRQFVEQAFYCARRIDHNDRGGKRLTWFCEQGVFHAVGNEGGNRIKYALNPDASGKGFAHWPGSAKVVMPKTIAKHWGRVPEKLRTAMDAILPPMAGERPVYDWSYYNGS